MRQIRKLRLGEPEPNDGAGTTQAERLAAVWELTRTAYAFKQQEGPVDARLRRDVVRTVRANKRTTGPMRGLADVEDVETNGLTAAQPIGDRRIDGQQACAGHPALAVRVHPAECQLSALEPDREGLDLGSG